MWALYTDYRYHWTPRTVGFSLMMAGVMSGLFQALAVKRLVPRLGETRSVLIGFTVAALAYIGYGLAPHGWMIFAIIGVACFAGLSGPALQSYISRHVPPNEQGAVQGVLGGLQSLASIPGALIATWSFGWAISPESPVHLPGLPLFGAAAFYIIALLLTWRSFRKDAAVAAKA
jgi:DHA1 family tetracycline resistance protein-like MFS transporter